MKLINQNLQYASALGFYESGISLAKQINKAIGNKSFEIAPVAAVNISFAAELFLKLLYHIETNKTLKNKHELDKIFLLLSKKLQCDIEERYLENRLNSNNELYPIKLTFNTKKNNLEDYANESEIENLTLHDLLKIHGNGFIKWRYTYEIDDVYYNYEFNFNLMNEFIKTLISVINIKTNKNKI